MPCPSFESDAEKEKNQLVPENGKESSDQTEFARRRNRILFLPLYQKGCQFALPNRLSLRRLVSKQFGVSKEVI